ncbi:MAG: radical SAM protein [Desulfobacteraceae bacterium]|nr:radical SAM protein [Desulfobacteraceae bacterium]
MKCNVLKIQAKSILQKSKLPESDYCINPYIGCTHGCIYCYARFMGRFTGHTKEKWGEYLDIKSNASELLERKLNRMKSHKGIFFIGSVTDAYQPHEKKYKVTRQLLKLLKNYDVHIVIQTKSNLILRDTDILSQFSQCDVGFTIITLDDMVRKIFEPRTSSIESRLDALSKLKNAGLQTYAFIGPIIPDFTDVKAVIEAVSYKVTGVMAESLNISAGNWNDIQATIKKYRPKIQTEQYKKRVKDPNYWMIVEQEYNDLCKKYSIKNDGFFNHQKDKKKSD